MSMSSIPSSSPGGKRYGWVEKIGNKVPHPFLLFIYLIAVLIAATAILSALNVGVQNPTDGSRVVVKNLLSVEGLHWFLPNVIKNFSGFAPLGAILALVLGAGKPVLAIFNNDPQVISLGYTRLVLVFSAYMFSMMYEVMSGYLRGFGISLTPAALTTLGVCGIRIFWIAVVFPRNPTFRTIMYVYPISLSTTALLIFLALLWFRPAKRAAERE